MFDLHVEPGIHFYYVQWPVLLTYSLKMMKLWPISYLLPYNLFLIKQVPCTVCDEGLMFNLGDLDVL